MFSAPTTPLSLAAASGDAAQVKAAIKAGASPSELDGDTTPIHRAAHAGHKSVVQALLAAGVPPALRDGRLVFPLLAATLGDQGAVVKHLLAAGAAVDDISPAGGGTCLHAAAGKGAVSALKALLAGGATVDARDVHGRTPLMVASMRGYDEASSQLVKAGAALNATDSDGESALSLALRSAFENRVDDWRVDLTASDGRPHAYVIRQGRIRHVDRGHHDWLPPERERRVAEQYCDDHVRYLDRAIIAKRLVRAGADLHVRDTEGYTPLLRACELGWELLMDIIRLGGDPWACLPDGRNAAHLGAASGGDNVARDLKSALKKAGHLENPGRVAALAGPDSRGWTLLHHVAYVQSPEVPNHRYTWNFGPNGKEERQARTTAPWRGIEAGARPIDIAVARGTGTDNL